MTLAPTPTTSFDVLTGPVHDQLLAAAASATTRAIGDPSHGVLVVIVRPDADDHHVVSGGGSGVLRAAVSVAVGAGNDRLWRDAPENDTIEQPTRSLPEVIAAAAEADGVRAVHTGCVRSGESIETVAIWFETWNGVASPTERREVLALLASAAASERTRRTEIAAAAAPVPVEVAADEPTVRTFDPNDPNLDAVTGLLTAECFEDHLLSFDRDEAMLVLIDLDGFSTVSNEWGNDVSDQILRLTADRLVETCRGNDIIGRVAHDRFAILFGELARSEALQISKRLIAAVAAPLPVGTGPANVTGTVAMAHQVGLVDLEEMFESATDALASGKRSGAGRLVLAA